MQYLRAYHNLDAFNYYDTVKGQVEIYTYDDELGALDTVEYESYATQEEIDERVNYINSNNFTSL